MNPEKAEWNGLGFLKIPLVRDTRLHIHVPYGDWYKRLVSNARIHDHNWSFAARVLTGALHVVDYRVVMAYEGAFSLYGMAGPVGDRKTTEVVHRGRCNVELVGRRVISAGETHYSTGPGHFHDTWAYRLTVTAMQKTSDSPPGRAPDVVGPRFGHGTIQDAFSADHDITDSDKDRLIDEAFSVLRDVDW